MNGLWPDVNGRPLLHDKGMYLVQEICWVLSLYGVHLGQLIPE